MIVSILLYAGGLLIVFIGILLVGLYSWEAAIKINNNPSYKNDASLIASHSNLITAFWISFFASIILLIGIILFVIFSEVLFYFLKPFLIITCVIYFIVLVIVEIYIVNGIINMKKSTNFSTVNNVDDETALRDARIGLFSGAIAIIIILVVIGIVIFSKVKKEKDAKKEEEEYEEDEEEEE